MGNLIFTVDITLLHDALKLPADVEITDIYAVYNPITTKPDLEVMVTSVNFPVGTHRVLPAIHKEPVKYTWDWSHLEPDRY